MKHNSARMGTCSDRSAPWCAWGKHHSFSHRIGSPNPRGSKNAGTGQHLHKPETPGSEHIGRRWGYQMLTQDSSQIHLLQILPIAISACCEESAEACKRTTDTVPCGFPSSSHRLSSVMRYSPLSRNPVVTGSGNLPTNRHRSSSRKFDVELQH